MGSSVSKDVKESTTWSEKERSSSSSLSLSTTDANPSEEEKTTTPIPVQQEEKSGCPMHRSDGSYSYNIWEMMKAASNCAFPHGATGSKPLLDKSVPLDETSMETSNTAAVDTTTAAANSSSGGGCPVKHAAKQSSPYPQFNVYSQPMDSTNQMPATPNQLPAPQQNVTLSTERVPSSIPKGGAVVDDPDTGSNTTTTWTYPSPQMFYNALARKNKLAGTSEEDMESIVALHNHMNEKTWAKILQWEELSCGTSNRSKLLRFQGRPHDLSPKARFKHYVLQHPLPYDRHDWIIERDDGQLVRYVIDYYHDEALGSDAPESATPSLHYDAGSQSLLVDVRPAADRIENIWNRMVAMPFARRVAVGENKKNAFEPLPMMPSPSMKTQVQESVQIWNSIQQRNQQQQKDVTNNDDPGQPNLEISDDEARKLARQFAQILTDCQNAQEKLDHCSDDMECARASLDWSLCSGRIVCNVQYRALVHEL
jgi:cytochrome c heme-lyase